MRLFLLLALAAVLVVTNPSEDDFAEFAEDAVVDELEGVAAVLPGGGLLGELGGMAAAGVVRRFAARDNYGVASVYTLDLDGRAREGEEWRFLGIAGLFFELKRPASLD